MTLSSHDYIYDQGILRDFKPDQCVVIKKKYLSLLKTLNYHEKSSDLSLCHYWYPLVNSYYPFTEDVDAYARVNHLMETVRSLSSIDSSLLMGSQQNFYGQKRPMVEMLNTKPMCYVILGKPGMGENELGRQLAHYRKCIYIDPKALLEEAIELGGRIGECIEFNLRSGRAIGIDVIIRLLPRKLETAEVQNRGCVLAGFPLIPNDFYEDDPISSESAVFNVKEIFEDIIETVTGDTISKKVEVSMASPTASYNTEKYLDEEEPFMSDVDFDMSHESVKSDLNICGSKNIAADLEKQMKILFGLFEFPFFVIYMYAGNADVIAKRESYRYDLTTQTTLDMQKINLFNDIGPVNEYLTRDIYDENFNPYIENLRCLLRLPKDFRGSVATQLDHYHKTIANSIDSKIMFHGPQYFIKLDARTYISNMFDIVNDRLNLYSIQKVLIPQRFSVSFADADAEGLLAEPEILTLSEAFARYSKMQNISPRYPWYWSDWGELCPVNMSRGKYVKGSSQYAVHFMNKIFFLADEEAWYKFYANPRPYLLPPFPRVGKRIIIYGPPFCGKSAIARSLQFIFNYTVMDYDDMQKEYIWSKLEEFKEIVRQAAIAEAIELLNQKKKEEGVLLEAQRQEKIAEWEAKVVAMLNQMLTNMEPESVAKQKSLRVVNLQDSIEIITDEELEEIKRQLSELNLPLSQNYDSLTNIVNNQDVRLNYLPTELQKSIEIEPATVLDPFVLDYAKKKVEEIKEENLAEYYKDTPSETYITVLHKMEACDSTNGWIIDGMLPNVELLRDVYETFPIDEVFLLYDRPGCPFLRNKFESITYHHKFYDFEDVLNEINEYEAAMQCAQSSSTDFKREMVMEIMENILSELEAGEEGSDEESELNIDQRWKIKQIALEKFLQEVEDYENGISDIEKFFKEIDKDIVKISVTDLEIRDLIKIAIKELRDRYRQTATPYTEADRANDLQIYLSENVANVEGENAEINPSDFYESRSYGDFYHYCPVTFAEHWVIWRGKEEYAAKFKNKLYLMATKQHLTDFLESPRKYLQLSKPPDYIPPPRICVVGVRGSGKSTISKCLAKNLGVHYISYEKMQTTVINKMSGMALNIDNIDEEPMVNVFLKLFAIWFEEPVQSIGFVLDGYPQSPDDFDMMLKNKTIPDLILNISVNQAEHLDKMFEYSMEEWRLEIEDNRIMLQNEFEEKHRRWEVAREERYNELLEVKRQERYAKKLEDIVSDSSLLKDRSETQVSLNSIDEQEDIDQVLTIIEEEYPEPIFNFNTESEEEAQARINIEVESELLGHSEGLEVMRQLCEKELIPWATINGSLPLEKTIIQSFLATDAIKHRNQSFFERCYLITSDIAERLLDVGYFFLSNFGRICPVHYFYQYNVNQTYTKFKNTPEIFSVIHRQYIYFIGSKKYYDEFTKDPLKFTKQTVNFPLVKILTGVIGPPKCGKTTLGTRLHEQLGLKLVSRGSAARYVLENLPFVNVAVEMEKVLRQGDELTDEMVMECVHIAMYTFDPVVDTFVCDGFPNNANELRHLKRLGIVPNVIFDLSIDDDTIYHFLEKMEGEHIYSKKFIGHRVDVWKEDAEDFRKFANKEYQNLYKFVVNKSCWGVYEESKEVVLAMLYEVKHYHKYMRRDWPLSISYMLVTPLEFLERQSSYKTYCPVCFYYEPGKLRNGGEPPNRAGLVHFREYFYWICPKHLHEFLKRPEEFIPPSNATLPDDLPRRVYPRDDNVPNLIEGGACMVCYSEKLPDYEQGTREFAVEYLGNVYYFDTQECMDAFMDWPIRYFLLRVRNNLEYPPLHVKDLPTMGLLEQTVAQQLVRSINHLVNVRPVVPGLSISVSALICIGLQLKYHNKKQSARKRDMYRLGLQLYRKRRERLDHFLMEMKNVLNPFVAYTDPVFDEPTTEISLTTTEEPTLQSDPTRRVPVPDERFDYLCEYFKPLSKVPAFLNVVDIAGLVKGASEGQGLGNAFLSHISACDAIFHLCRAFEDDDVTHVEGEINPVRDLDIISEELRLKDEDTLEKNLEKLERTVGRGGDKKLKPEYDTLVKIKSVLVDEKKHIRFGDWDAKDIEVLNKYLFLTSKPTIYLVNLSEKDYIKKKNKWLIKIKEWVDKNDPGALIIPFSGVFEHKLLEEYGSDEAGRKKFLEDSNATSALEKIIVQGYKALQLEYFFTAGADEVKAWTIQKGTKAPQAAGRIHTDFEKGFIMAEVMKFVDFKEEGSETACKAAGKYRQQGRNYVVEDGDIIFFKFNAGAGLKDAKKK